MDLRYLPVVDRLWAAFRAAGFPVEGQYEYVEWRSAFLKQAGTDWFEAAQVAALGKEEPGAGRMSSACFMLLPTG